jgi:hypothetical protein
MMTLMKKFKAVLQKHGSGMLTDTTELEFIKTRKLILRELATSRDAGTVVGINSPALGEGLFITAVEDLYSARGGDVVHLKPYAMSGHILPRTQLSLTEIRSVCSFKTIYRNPIFC